MKIHLPNKLRAALVAAILSFSSFTVPTALAKGVVAVPTEAADSSAAREQLTLPTLRENSAYNLNVNWLEGVFSFNKYIWNEASLTLSPVLLDLGVNPVFGNDVSFNWHLDADTGWRSLVQTPSFEHNANVLASVANTQRLASVTANVDRDFVGVQYNISGVGEAFGGALSHTDDTLVDLTIGSHFVGNAVTCTADTADAEVYAYGGGIYSTAAIKSVVGDFLNNSVYAFADASNEGSAHANGGAIYASVGVSSINGDFISNYAAAKVTTDGEATANATGGAIDVNRNVTSIVGDFLSNSASATATALGESYIYAYAGAINNNYVIERIVGDFSGNTASVSVSVASTVEVNVYAHGGAIRHYGNDIEIIDGDFVSNSVNVSASGTANYNIYASGGAIYNTGTIGSLTGDFFANSVSSNVGGAEAGAIYNAATIKALRGNFVGNYASASAAGQAYGGAISNYGSIQFLADKSAILISGNYITTDGGTTKEYQAIYNTSYSSDAEVYFNAYEGHSIVVNDAIFGDSSKKSNQIIHINKLMAGTESLLDSSATAFSTVTLNNKVENQIINVHAGTLVLGSVEESENVPKSQADLESCILNISAGARVESHFGHLNHFMNSITNGGTLALTGGRVNRDILGSGVLSIEGDVEVGFSDYIKVTDVQLHSKGTLSLFGGTLAQSLTGAGKLRIADDSVQFSQANQHTGGTIISTSYTLSDAGVLGTGAVTVDQYRSLSLNKVTLNNSLTMQKGASLSLDASSQFMLDADTSLNVEFEGGTLSFSWNLLQYEDRASLDSLDDLIAKITVNGLALAGSDYSLGEDAANKAITFIYVAPPVALASHSLTETSAVGDFTVTLRPWDDVALSYSTKFYDVGIEHVGNEVSFNWVADASTGNRSLVQTQGFDATADVKFNASATQRESNPGADVNRDLVGIATVNDYGGAMKIIIHINVKGSFIGNSVSSTLADYNAIAGAIFVSAAMGSIEGNFIGNAALGSSNKGAFGGAIYNDYTKPLILAITSIKGDFIANYAYGSVAAGGAITTYGNLGLIEGDFIGNYAAAIDGDALGGAIDHKPFNFPAGMPVTLVRLTGDLIGNYASSINGTARGGAIFNRDGSVAFVALTQGMQISGNYVSENGKVSSNALYSDYTQTNTVFHFNAYGQNSIVVNDGISGNAGQAAHQILNINNGLDGAGAVIDAEGKSFGTVYFNNKVENHTINLKAGTLGLHEFEGMTLASGVVIEKAHAQLVNCVVNIDAGAKLNTNANYIDSTSTVNNAGTIAFTGGTIDRNYSGEIEIVGDVSSKASYMNGSSTMVNDNATLTLTEGTLTRAVDGLGKLRFDGQGIALTAASSYSGGSSLVAGASVNISDNDALGTGAVLLEAGSKLSLEGANISNALSMQWSEAAEAQILLDATSSITTDLNLDSSAATDSFTWIFLSWEDGALVSSLTDLQKDITINGQQYSAALSAYYSFSQQGTSYVLSYDSASASLSFKGQWVEQSDIDGKNLVLANFTQASATELDFSGMDLTLANFTDADLQGSDFGTATFADNTWDGVDLRGIKPNMNYVLPTGIDSYVNNQGILKVDGRVLERVQYINRAVGSNPAVVVNENLNIAQNGELSFRSGGQLIVGATSKLTLSAGGNITMQWMQGSSDLTQITVRSGSELDMSNGSLSLHLLSTRATPSVAWTWDFLVWEDATAALTQAELELILNINGMSLSESGFELGYENGSYSLIKLITAPDSYTQLSSSGNAGAGGELLDKAAAEQPAAGTDLADVLTVLDDIFASAGTGTAESERILSAVAGAAVTSLGSASLGNMEGQLMRMHNRAGGFMPAGESNYWISAEGSRNELDGDGAAAGHNIDNWGGSIGVDWGVIEDLSVGFAVTALYGDLDANSVDAASGELDSYYLSLTAQYQSGKWQHRALMSWGWVDASLDRHISYAGGSYSTTGDTDGSSFGFMYEVGYDIQLGESSTLTPIFNAVLVHNSIDGYTESGSDAALRVGEQENTIATFGIGARIENTLDSGLQLGARALFKVDAGDRVQEADVSIAGVAGSHARIEGADAGSVGVELGVGASMPVGDSGEVYFDAFIDMRENQQNGNASVGYRIAF